MITETYGEITSRRCECESDARVSVHAGAKDESTASDAEQKKENLRLQRKLSGWRLFGFLLQIGLLQQLRGQVIKIIQVHSHFCCFFSLHTSCVVQCELAERLIFKRHANPETFHPYFKKKVHSVCRSLQISQQVFDMDPTRLKK